jgi:hypothetical protein
MARPKKNRDTVSAPVQDADLIPTPETGDEQLDAIDPTEVAAQDAADLAPQSDAADPEGPDDESPTVAESEAAQSDVDAGQVPPEQPVSRAMDIPFAASVIGIPTGNFESRIARFNATEIEQLTEASVQANRALVLAVFANATRRLEKPNLPLGKKQTAG